MLSDMNSCSELNSLQPTKRLHGLMAPEWRHRSEQIQRTNIEINGANFPIHCVRCKFFVFHFQLWVGKCFSIDVVVLGKKNGARQSAVPHQKRTFQFGRLVMKWRWRSSIYIDQASQCLLSVIVAWFASSSLGSSVFHGLRQS